MKAPKRDALLRTLQQRFEKNVRRHEGVAWKDVVSRIDGSADALTSIHEMEETGGEPDVIGRDAKSGVVTICDCSAESPSGRRSLCFDAEALAARKENKPKGSAMATAADWGVELLTEAEYAQLQQVGEFDLKTSSWLKTPDAVRKLGGALFGDRRYDRVFTYHNGADSYYAARAFRCVVRL